MDRCNVRAEAEGQRAEEVSAGPDAGAVVPLQPGLRRLRQDSVSGAYSEGGADAGGGLEGCRGMWYPDGCDSGRRAAAASADAGDCCGPGGAEEVCLHVYECAAAERE